MKRKQVIKDKQRMNALYGYKHSVWTSKRWHTITYVWDKMWKTRARGYHNKILT